MRKPLRTASLFAFVLTATLAGCTTVRSGEELKTVFDSGVAAYDAGDYPKAYAIWSTLQDQDVSAMINLAKMLREGVGVPKNPKKAEELYAQAAEVSPIAAAALGDMLLKGEAAAPDPHAALPLLLAAAASENPIAQYDLAQLYETGGAVPRDIPTARNLYAAAAGHGMKEAQARLDQLGPAPADAPNQSIRLMQPAPTAPTTTAANPPPIRPGQP